MINMWILAQNASQWPRPYSYFFFDFPWYLIGMMLLSTVILIVVYMISGRRNVLFAIVSFTLSILLLLGLSALITTDHEHIKDQTRRLVGAVVENPPALEQIERLLAEDVILRLGDRPEAVTQGEPLQAMVERGIHVYGVKAYFIWNLRTKIEQENTARSYMHIFTEMDEDSQLQGVNSMTEWIFTWQRDAQGQWRIHAIQWLSLNGQPPQDAWLP